ncbi:hypothetical protein CBOM_05633 [Ceraceosorus bombacis]|uniref:Uncharacterized protein n=1 Tax=Ceraceosorus bombacis TaxID=401625 RepID=A0A0P1BSN0_9BASI|nr:hypothetical protein CBOM_05633 [Ceraceosorus bombacis]
MTRIQTPHLSTLRQIDKTHAAVKDIGGFRANFSAYAPHETEPRRPDGLRMCTARLERIGELIGRKSRPHHITFHRRLGPLDSNSLPSAPSPFYDWDFEQGGNSSRPERWREEKTECMQADS